MKCFDNILSNFSIDNELIVLGDMNIDLRPNRNSNHTKNYKEVLKNHGLKQIIVDSTRKSNTCSSLIDHIVVSKQCNILQSGVLPTSISDHCTIFCTRKLYIGNR